MFFTENQQGAIRIIQQNLFSAPRQVELERLKNLLFQNPLVW